MFKVEIHDNSLEYFKNLVIEKDSLHVTANSTLSNLILEENKYINKNINTYKKIVVYIEELKEKLYPKWVDMLVKNKLKMELREEIIELKKKFINDNTCRKLNYFINNIEDVLDCIMFFAECGIEIIPYSENYSIEYEEFRRVYNTFFYNVEFQKIYHQLTKNKKLIYRDEEEKTIRINKIYFYNISEIDIRRFMLFNRLKDLGYDIAFRIPYFNGLKEINKCWDTIYIKDIFHWNYMDKDFSQFINKSKYISFIEGIEPVKESNEDVITKTYYEISEFDRDSNNKRIITFLKDSIKECTNYKNEKDKHCYQTDLGRFIKCIYQCKLVNNDIKMNYNTFIQLITSGWIEYIENNYVYNGRKALEFLKESEDYFKDSETIEEILKRIYNLKNVKEVGAIFEGLAKNEIQKNKRKLILANPFRCLSYANIDQQNVTIYQLTKLTEKLKHILQKLLSNDNGFIVYQDHINMLKSIYKKNFYINKLYKNDKNKWFLEKIFSALNYNIEKTRIHIEELKELFNILLSNSNYKGNFADKEDINISIDQLEGFIDRKKFTLNNQNNLLHISDLSYKAYQQYINTKINHKFILEKNTMDTILKNAKEENKKIIEYGIKLEALSKENANNFLKFVLGNVFINFKGKLIFSWIRDIRENDSKSIILRQMENLYKNREENNLSFDVFDSVEETNLEYKYNKVYDEVVYEDKHSYISDVAYRDLDFCEEKFLYSSIISPYPVYRTDFHHRLVLSVLISLIKNNIDNDYDSIRKYIFHLFPQWQDIVKENIFLINYSKRNFREYKNFEGLNYPKNIDYLYILKSKYIVTEKYKIKNRYRKDNLDTKDIFKDFLKVYLKKDYIHNKGKHCLMCPHIYVCRKGDFVVDSQGRF